MKRLAYTKLLAWQKSTTRKPLLLQGARQVGKSYLLECFGRNEFKQVFIFNFEQNPGLHKIFQPDLQPTRILQDLALVAGQEINKKNDLVIFDEIQECPKAITSLKYFCELLPELAVCCAGSLLGVKLSTESFPVGKVDFLSLFPLNFHEFLLAAGNDLLVKAFTRQSSVSEISHDMLWQVLKEYFITGGMPQVVKEYLDCRENVVEARLRVRTLQKSLLTSYYKDFAKHAGANNSMHIVSIFEDIPLQLARNIDASVKRYKFKGVISGKKSFAELQGPIQWLVQAGLALKVKICKRADLPLATFCKSNTFKLFLFDVGLLGCMLDLPVEAILDDDYGIAKGYFAENFVAQELTAAAGNTLYSWAERNSEIEFLVVEDGKIIPIEVKAGTRTQAKSLRQYISKYSPSKAIILAKKIYHNGSNSPVAYVPLYAAGICLKNEN